MSRKRLSLAERQHKELRIFAGAALRRFLVNCRKLGYCLKTGSFEAALPDQRVCDRSKWAKISQKPGITGHSAEFSHSLDQTRTLQLARDALPQASLGCDNALEPTAPYGSCGGYFSMRTAALEPRIKHCGRIR
jgi:hypothetical protein